MKKIFILFATFTLVALSACNDFLDEKLEGTYSTGTFYKTAAHAELAITGIYNTISFNSTNNAIWVFGDVVSDDAVKGGNPGDLSDVAFLEEFNYSRSNEYLDKMWRQYYEGITRINFLLYYSDNLVMDDVRKAEILAEAKFLRAYLYFNLVNIYGEIPLRTTPVLSPDANGLVKSSVATVYQQIEKDLTEALPALKPKPSKVGEASQGAAYGLLAKANLYEGKWQASLDAITSLEALGLYALQPVYKNNFIDSTQNNSESIFEIQHIKGVSLGSFLNQFFSPAVENGYFFNQPTANFVNAFEKTATNVYDPRLDYTVGREGHKWMNGEDFDPAWSSTGFLGRKHVQPLHEVPAGTKGDASLNYVYMRYADVLLMKAEALNELNRTADAIIPLNLVRKRARESYLFDKGLAGYGTVPAALLPDVAASSQSNVREAIRHERRVELGFEFHRYFDLMRYGKTAAENALGTDVFNYETKRYFLTPQSEIDTNPLVQ
ncbi:MAG: RagB/SusD family nutrient uptake outer membrane protein [Cytophaga sp.]|nr:RagB/SusD family nutrient uptake outer membrane protein [Cytophaga sp.]